MALKLDANMSGVAHHIVDGPVTFPYAIDAHSAISRFPGEWSLDPWSVADAAAARKEAGQPAIEPTPEEQTAMDEHAKAVAEANDRLKKFRADQEEKKKIDEQVAADEALVASPAPRPDPNVRRPLSGAQIRKNAAMTDEEKAAKAAQDKADADRAAGNAPVTQF